MTFTAYRNEPVIDISRTDIIKYLGLTMDWDGTFMLRMFQKPYDVCCSNSNI